MRRGAIIALTMCGCMLACPAPVMASQAASGAAVAVEDQQGSVQLTGTDKLAVNYRPADGDNVIGSWTITNGADQCTWHFQVPQDYVGRTAHLYVERPNDDGCDNHVTIVPAAGDGIAFVPFTFVAKEGSTVTLVIDLWDKNLSEDLGSTDAFDQDAVHQTLDAFSRACTYDVYSLTSDDALIKLRSTKEGAIVAASSNPYCVMEVSALNGTDDFWFYADHYRPAENGGFCLGTFTYDFAQTDNSAIAGLAFTVDPKYAGQTAKVYIDPEYGSIADAPYATYTLTIGEDGSFTVPIAAMVGDEDSLELKPYAESYPSGWVSVNIEPSEGTAVPDPDQPLIDYGDFPETLITEEGMSIVIESTTLPLTIQKFDTNDYRKTNEWVEPVEGGAYVGSFGIMPVARGAEIGTMGEATLRMSVDEQYAGRTVTFYILQLVSGQDAFGSSTKTATIADDGTFTLTVPTIVPEVNEDTGVAHAYVYGISVNIEPGEEADEPTPAPDPETPTPNPDPEDPDDSDDPVWENPFTDVVEGTWYYDAVRKASELGIMNGYDDGSGNFGPNDVLTREQAAAVLYNYLGAGDMSSADAPKDDVAQGQWYSEAVNWAVAHGVMSGYSGSDTFGIGEPLTREQFCAVIANAMGADLDCIDLSVLDVFPDSDSISAWARPAVAWAVENGVISGREMPDGTRELQGPTQLTRAEMAAMTVNAIQAGVLAAK